MKAQRIAPGAIYLSDTNASEQALMPDTDYSLCRTAQVRRIIRAARGHISCTQNLELHTTGVPNDPSYALQYGHTLMADPAAWDITQGSDSILVVIVDSGIDYNHPDLQRNLWRNPGDRPGNNVDDDKNGYIDDVYGINAITNSGNPWDDNRHGTHVAGIVGAEGNNYLGVAGVAWKVKLVGAKFISSNGSGSTANAIKAITYATSLKKAGYNVVATNNSWGGGEYSKPLLDAILAAGEAGVLFIAAAGNNSRDSDINPSYPASYQAPNIISVASVSRENRLSSFSNYGAKSVHIAAPGGNILSTLPANRYGELSGTSMAAPQVTGLAALALSACPKMDPQTLKRVILSNGLPSSRLTGLVSTGSTANSVGAVLGAKEYCKRLEGQPPSPPPSTGTPPPTITPTPTPTPTPSPTRTNTPTPTPTPMLVLRPSVIADPGWVRTYASTNVKLDKRGSYGSIQTYLWFELDDGFGYRQTCPKIPVLSSSTTANFKLSMPSFSSFFEEVKIVVATQNRVATATVGLPGINPNFRGNQEYNGRRLCEHLAAQVSAAIIR